MRPVLARHIGKEGNKLDEREVGLATDEEATLRLDDPARSPSQRYTKPALAAFRSKDIASATGRGPGPLLTPGVAEAQLPDGQPLWTLNPPMAERTIRNSIRYGTTPTPEHERLLTVAAVGLAAERLHQEGMLSRGQRREARSSTKSPR